MQSRIWTRQGAGLFVLLALVPGAWFATVSKGSPHFGLMMDDAILASSARALAEGRGYVHDVLPGSPPQTKYPPGMAFAMAPMWMVARNTAEAVRLMTFFTWICFCVLVWLLPRLYRSMGFGDTGALGATGLTAISPYVVFLASCVLTEIPFLLLVVLTVLVAGEAERRGSVALAAVAGVAAGAAVSLRTAALPLAAALVIWLLWKRRMKLAAAAMVCPVVAAGGWMAWAGAHKPVTGDVQLRFYLDYVGFWRDHVSGLGDFVFLVERNLSALSLSMGNLLWFDLGGPPALVFMRTVVTVVAVAGGFLMLQRGLTLLHLFSWGYAAMLVVWNFTPDERLTLPLLPLLLAGLIEAGRRVLTDVKTLCRAGAGLRKAVGAAMAVAVCGTAAVVAVSSLVAIPTAMRGLVEREAARRAALAPVIESGRKAIEEGEAVLAYQEGRAWLQLGRHAMGMPVPTKLSYEARLSEIGAYLLGWPEVARKHGLRYVLLTPWDFELDIGDAARAAYHRSVREYPGAAVLIEKNGAAIVSLGDEGTGGE